MNPICPYCKKELLEESETDENTTFFCCSCKLMIVVYDMTDTEPCNGE